MKKVELDFQTFVIEIKYSEKEDEWKAIFRNHEFFLKMYCFFTETNIIDITKYTIYDNRTKICQWNDEFDTIYKEKDCKEYGLL